MVPTMTAPAREHSTLSYIMCCIGRRHASQDEIMKDGSHCHFSHLVGNLTLILLSGIFYPGDRVFSYLRKFFPFLLILSCILCYTYSVVIMSGQSGAVSTFTYSDISEGRTQITFTVGPTLGLSR